MGSPDGYQIEALQPIRASILKKPWLPKRLWIKKGSTKVSGLNGGYYTDLVHLNFNISNAFLDHAFG